MDRIKIKNFKEKLTNQDFYRASSKEVAGTAIKFFLESVPDSYNFDGEAARIKSIAGVGISARYNRIVVNTYGAFLELDIDDINITKLYMTDFERHKMDFLDTKYKNAKICKLKVVGDKDTEVLYCVRETEDTQFKLHKYYIAVEDTIKGE